MLVVGVGVLLAAAYNLRAVRSVVQGTGESAATLGDLNVLETFAVSATAAAVVVLGVAPWLVTRSATAALTAVAELVGRGGL
jgi:NADH:ubiquinone oxidoreductase subunit 4 (subunit M)